MTNCDVMKNVDPPEKNTFKMAKQRHDLPGMN
jgi:hypothetical protein